MNSTVEHTRNLFRENNIRCTRQRELVYIALTETNAHPTADELRRAVLVHDESVSLATVYNALEIFVESGLCRKLASTVASGPSRYDIRVHDHVHGVMPDGEIVDLPPDLSQRVVAAISPDLRREIESRLSTKVRRVAIELVFTSTGSKRPADADADRGGPAI